MKQTTITLFTTLLIIVSLNALHAQQATPASYKRSEKAIRPMAAEGEKVWIIVNHIKPDKKEQFERFINEVFWLMAKRLSTQEQQLFKQTRVLYPQKAEADGTYSYFFIMDPVIPGGNYGIERLLKKMYGEQKGIEYAKMFAETQAQEQTQYEVMQSRY